MTEQELEGLLRRAPHPAPPPALKSQLQAGIEVASTSAPRSQRDTIPRVPAWRRWFPALSFGVLLLGCFVVLAVQTTRLLELRRENTALRAATANLEQLRQDNAELQRLQTAAQKLDRDREEQDQLLKTRAEVERLRASVQQSSRVRAENQRLTAEHAAAVAKAGLTAEVDPFQESKSRAERVRCISNIKQIGLAARMWANDHKEILPPDYLSMTNEMPSPALLTCPSDTLRTPVKTWQNFDGSSVSYELLSPNVPESDPAVVFIRCLIHHNAGLVDGSAHQLDAERQRVMPVEGKYRIVPVQPPPQP